MMILRRIAPPIVAAYRSVHRRGDVLRLDDRGPGRGRRSPTPISWRDDYGGALEEAKATNRLLWIQFTGPWCPNCMRMERDSFPDADVIEHAQRSFVPLKLRSDVHEQLALGFNLSGLPATVLVAPTREIVAVRQGYLGPDELEQLLSEVLAAWRGREAATGRGRGRVRRHQRAAPIRRDPRTRPRLAPLGILPGQPDLRPAAGPGPDRVHRPA